MIIDNFIKNVYFSWVLSKVIITFDVGKAIELKKKWVWSEHLSWMNKVNLDLSKIKKQFIIRDWIKTK